MKIGSAWTRQSKDGRTFISVVLDETVLELIPQLKNCNLSLGYISPEDRKSDKAPGWMLNLSAKREDKDSKKAEQNIAEDATKPANDEVVTDDQIPF